MIQLGTCSSCKGFLGIAVRACPHCGIALGRARRIVAGLTGLAGGGAVSMTLMACYGPGCVNEECRYDGPDDAGRTAADARVTPFDASADASDASRDGGSDAPFDGAFDAASEAASDASNDAPADAPNAD